MIRSGLHIEWSMRRDPVELGKGFSLVVTRRWPRDVVALPFDDKSLAPLTVTLDRVETRELAGQIEETRAYTAHAFSLDRIETSPLVIRVRAAEGDVRTAESAPVEIDVSGALRGGAVLGAELPAHSPPLPTPQPFSEIGPSLITSSLLLIGVAAWTAWRRRWSPPTPKERVSPSARARSRLAAIYASTRKHQARRANHELANLLHEYLRAAFLVVDEGRPSAEILAAERGVAVMGEEERERFVDLIARLDRRRFSADPSEPSDREGLSQLVSEAAALIEAVSASRTEVRP